jgi:hypothetical protein
VKGEIYALFQLDDLNGKYSWELYALIKLKCILKIQGGNIYTGLIWLRMGISDMLPRALE